MTKATCPARDSSGRAAVAPSRRVTWVAYSLIAVTLVGLWLMQSAFTVAPLHTSLPGITAEEPVTGIVLGVVVFGDSIRVFPGLILLEPSGLIALLIGVILVARSRHSRGGTDAAHPGFEVHPAWKMAATGSWRLRQRRGVGHGCGQEGEARREGSQEED